MATIDEILDRIPNSFGVSRRILDADKFTDSQIESFARKVGSKKINGFVIDDANRFVYVNIIKWFFGMPNILCHAADGSIVQASLFKGLYICGQTGTGKSVALDVLSTLADNVNVDVKSGAEVYKLKWKTYIANEVAGSYASNGLISPFIDEKVISIQDLGSEPTEAVFMGNRCNVLKTVIECRADRERLTLFSSNFKMYGDKIRAAYGDRVASRLPAMCNYYILGGNDRRK